MTLLNTGYSFASRVKPSASSIRRQDGKRPEIALPSPVFRHSSFQIRSSSMLGRSDIPSRRLLFPHRVTQIRVQLNRQAYGLIPAHSLTSRNESEVLRRFMYEPRSLVLVVTARACDARNIEALAPASAIPGIYGLSHLGETTFAPVPSVELGSPVANRPAVRIAPAIGAVIVEEPFGRNNQAAMPAISNHLIEGWCAHSPALPRIVSRPSPSSSSLFIVTITVSQWQLHSFNDVAAGRRDFRAKFFLRFLKGTCKRLIRNLGNVFETALRNFLAPITTAQGVDGLAALIVDLVLYPSEIKFGRCREPVWLLTVEEIRCHCAHYLVILGRRQVVTSTFVVLSLQLEILQAVKM